MKRSRRFSLLSIHFITLVLILWSCSSTKLSKEETEAGLTYAEIANRLTDINVIMRGMLVYEQACAVCHGPNGEGGVGNNFNDFYWIHGNRYEDIVRITRYGVVEKGRNFMKRKGS